MTAPTAAPSATLIIFGAFGDLTARLLVPALANLARDGLLDPGTRFIGVDIADGDDTSLAESLHAYIEGDDGWNEARARICYLKGDFTSPRPMPPSGR